MNDRDPFYDLVDVHELQAESDQLRRDLQARRERNRLDAPLPVDDWRAAKSVGAMTSRQFSAWCDAGKPPLPLVAQAAAQANLDRQPMPTRMHRAVLNDPHPKLGPGKASLVRRSVVEHEDEGSIIGPASTPPTPDGVSSSPPPSPLPEAPVEQPDPRAEDDMEMTLTRSLAQLSMQARAAGVSQSVWGSLLLTRAKLDARADGRNARYLLAYTLARVAFDLDADALDHIRDRARWS